MDNSEKIINKIREQDVRPLPRWRFTLKNATAWSVFILAALLGALAFSVVLFAIQQVDFKLVSHLSHSWFETLLALLPFFWVISLVIMLAVAMIGIKNSKKGYKFNSLSLVVISATLSILIGTLFFISGGGKWLDRTFEANIDTYESIQDRKEMLWSMPEDGYLAGTISAVGGDQLELEDFNGDIWKINISGSDIVPAVSLEKGEKVKLIGEMTSRGNFIAEKIRPWGGEIRMKGYRQKK